VPNFEQIRPWWLLGKWVKYMLCAKFLCMCRYVFQRLVQGSDDCQDNWSMSELMHAVVLLAHFHSLASFVFGCGVTSETDHPDGHVYSTTMMTDEHSDVDNDNDATTVNGHPAATAEVLTASFIR